jgi:hypothetical protein
MLIVQGFEVITAVVMMSLSFWDLTSVFRWNLTDVAEVHIAVIFRVEM